MSNKQHHLPQQELADYVVHNSEYYEKYRKQFNEEKRFKSLNLMALLLTPVWASYRRVWILYWLPLLLQGVLIALGIVRFRPQFYGLPEYLQFIIYLTFLFVILGTIGLLLRANFFLLLKAKNSLEQNKTATSHWFIVLIASVLFYAPVITVLTPSVITFFEPKPQPVIKEVSLFIQSAVYDDKRTPQTDDDILYIYFSKDIDPTQLNNLTSSYKLEGVGAFGSQAQADYQHDIFRHRIKLGKDAIPFEVGKTTIALHDQFGKNNSMVIKPFNYFGRLAESSIPSDNDYIYKDFTSWLFGEKTVRGLARKYINNGDNTVTDLTTQLMWQDEPPMEKINKFTLKEGVKYCDSLNNNTNYNNWRLPNFFEILTISDRGYSTAKPPAFLYTLADYKVHFYIEEYMEYLFHSNKNDTNSENSAAEESNRIRYEKLIRCVRQLNNVKISNTIEPYFIKDEIRNVIIDASTNLMWQNEALTLSEEYASRGNSKHGKIQNERGAINYCNNLSLAGYSDWVLPTITEFFSLASFNQERSLPSRDYSPFDYHGLFWTSTRHKSRKYNDGSRAYLMHTYYNRSMLVELTDVSDVRCVRIID